MAIIRGSPFLDRAPVSAKSNGLAIHTFSACIHFVRFFLLFDRIEKNHKFYISIAGGSSAHLHVLSAESRKYFRNAIAMSGSAVHFWAMTTAENHVNIAFEMAARFGQPQANVSDLVELLKSLPAKEFIEFTTTEWLQAGAFKFPICPLIESRLQSLLARALILH